MGIVTMWMILKQKISDEISARDIKINTSITAEITKIKKEINTKISDELSARDTKVTNELTARLSETISSFTVELGKINTELNSKLTAEIEKIKARDAGYTTEAQKILGRLNNIKEACHNDFGSITSRFMSINVVIEDLQNRINQHYTVVQRSDLDQQSVSNESEVNSTNESETDSRGSQAQALPVLLVRYKHNNS
jgi:hypothetical protein